MPPKEREKKICIRCGKERDRWARDGSGICQYCAAADGMHRTKKSGEDAKLPKPNVVNQEPADDVFERLSADFCAIVLCSGIEDNDQSRAMVGLLTDAANRAFGKLLKLSNR